MLEFILDEEAVPGRSINTLTAGRSAFLNLQKREPTLEDVFVDLVGTRAWKRWSVGVRRSDEQRSIGSERPRLSTHFRKNTGWRLFFQNRHWPAPTRA
jgi:hypothetical protein